MKVIMSEAEKRYLRIAEIATTIIAVFFIAFTLGCNIGKNEAKHEAKVKYREYEQKIADMECEKFGLNEEETASAIEKAQKKFRHHQAWVKLVEESPMQVDCSLEEFLGNLDRVYVSFEKNGCTRIERFLFDGIGILLKDEKAFEHIVGAYIPATCSPEFLVHIPAKVIPAEFIKKYIEQKKEQEV